LHLLKGHAIARPISAFRRGRHPKYQPGILGIAHPVANARHRMRKEHPLLLTVQVIWVIDPA
jgi:hypothetical protein